MFKYALGDYNSFNINSVSHGDSRNIKRVRVRLNSPSNRRVFFCFFFSNSHSAVVSIFMLYIHNYNNPNATGVGAPAALFDLSRVPRIGIYLNKKFRLSKTSMFIGFFHRTFVLIYFRFLYKSRLNSQALNCLCNPLRLYPFKPIK